MTMSEFVLFPQEKQLTILYRQSVYIGKKKGGQFIRLLFQLEGFYVEIVYLSYRRSIYKMRYSDSTAILDPYLEQIEVEYLVT